MFFLEFRGAKSADDCFKVQGGISEVDEGITLGICDEELRFREFCKRRFRGPRYYSFLVDKAPKHVLRRPLKPWNRVRV